VPDHALAQATWTEVAASRPLLAVPVGSCEQHGPHLPLDTDTRIAAALVERLALDVDGVIVAPAVAYGSSGEHAGFPGTLSIGRAALELVLVELGRSADHFRGVVFVNGHGGNAASLVNAVTTLRAEQRNALAWSPTVAGGDAHAGRTETSLLLAIDPGVVRLGRAARGDTRPLSAVIDELRSAGVAAVSPNGVLGDPAGASADEGTRLLTQLRADLAACVRRWCS
jgi:mycofactocin system creatininase family protein